MVYIKWRPPGKSFFGRKRPSGFSIYSDLGGGIDSEVMEFDEMYHTLVNILEDLNKKGVGEFITTYGKNKRIKEGNVVKFYFIMDGEPGYDKDEYEFVFEDTFESLEKAINSFKEEAKQYLY